jgi:hypothetical protein
MWLVCACMQHFVSIIYADSSWGRNLVSYKATTCAWPRQRIISNALYRAFISPDTRLRCACGWGRTSQLLHFIKKSWCFFFLLASYGRFHQHRPASRLASDPPRVVRLCASRLTPDLPHAVHPARASRRAPSAPREGAFIGRKPVDENMSQQYVSCISDVCYIFFNGMLQK